MSEIQKELDDVIEQIEGLPAIMRNNRIEVVKQVSKFNEMLTLDKMNALLSGKYETVKKYGEERNILANLTTSGSKPYNLDHNGYQSLASLINLRFPSMSGFVGYLPSGVSHKDIMFVKSSKENRPTTTIEFGDNLKQTETYPAVITRSYKNRDLTPTTDKGWSGSAGVLVTDRFVPRMIRAFSKPVSTYTVNKAHRFNFDTAIQFDLCIRLCSNVVFDITPDVKLTIGKNISSLSVLDETVEINFNITPNDLVRVTLTHIKNKVRLWINGFGSPEITLNTFGFVCSNFGESDSTFLCDDLKIIDMKTNSIVDQIAFDGSDPSINTVIDEFTGVDVVVLDEFDMSLENPPDIGDKFAIFDNTTKLALGEVIVGVEGIGIDRAWVGDPINIHPTISAVQSWLQSSLEISNSRFKTLVGGVLTSSPNDDIFKSSNGNVSSSVAPYDEIEKAPFFPALNGVESDSPEDFDTIDVKNRRQTINGSHKWVVRPSIRWECKRHTNDAGVSPNSEINNNTIAVDRVSAVKNYAVENEVTDWPITEPSKQNASYDNIYYDSSENLLYNREQQFRETYHVPVTYEVVHVFNELTNFINNQGALFKDAVDKLITFYAGFTDIFSSTNDAELVDIKNRLIDVRNKYNDFVSYHENVFPSDWNNLTSKFLEANIRDYPLYSMTKFNAFKNAVVSQNMDGRLSTRTTRATNIIGSAASRTGYVGDVIKSVDMLVNKNFGVFVSLNDALSKDAAVEQLALKLIRKYHALR